MKTLITIIVIMFMVGCGKSEVEKLEAENKRLEAKLKVEKHKLDTAEKNKSLKEDLLKLSVVGSYVNSDPIALYKLIFHDNGIAEEWSGDAGPYTVEQMNEYVRDGKLVDARYDYQTLYPVGKWKIVRKEVQYVMYEKFILVYKIEPNSDLTRIALIRDGKRENYPKEKQRTYKKIK